MENTEFDMKTLVSYIEREYCLDRESVIGIIEESIQKSALKNSLFTSSVRISVDRDDLSVHVYDTVVVSNAKKGTGFISSSLGRILNKGVRVSEGDVIEVEFPISRLGRVCARESKMLILQKIKSAKSAGIANLYKERIGHVVTGIVSGIERGNVIVTVNGKTEMVIPREEGIGKEHFKIGDQVSGMIVGINERQRNSPIVLSRASDAFVETLFKREVPELGDGTIEIVGISRIPGTKTKLLVKSNNAKVDPIGTCVGRGGAHLRRISDEFHGERIDIVRYSDNVLDVVKDALLPSRIDSIGVDAYDGSSIVVTVSPDEYSKAVGRGGINVKLASSLVKRKIRVEKAVYMMSFEEQRKNAIEKLAEILSITMADSETVVNSGYLTPDSISSEDLSSFISATGLDEVTGSGIHAAAVAVSNYHEII